MSKLINLNNPKLYVRCGNFFAKLLLLNSEKLQELTMNLRQADQLLRLKGYHERALRLCIMAVVVDMVNRARLCNGRAARDFFRKACDFWAAALEY